MASEAEIIGTALKINPDISRSFAPALLWRGFWLIMIGGAGSGKSQTAVRKIILRCCEERNHKFLITRKIGSTIRNSILALFLEILRKWKIPYTHNKSDMTIYLPLCESYLIFSGLDDPEKIKSIQGITGVLMEEGSDFYANDFKEISRRMRGETPGYKQIIVCLNPDAATPGGAYIKETFVDNKDPEAYVHESTVLDNAFAERSYIDRLEREKDPTARTIYYLGGWASAHGIIFPAFQVVDALFGVDQKIYGIDFGFNDPSVVLDLGICGLKVGITELMHRSECITKDIIKCLDDNKVEKTAPIYCDNAEPDRIQEIFNAGYRGVKPARKDVQAGISFVKRYELFSLAGNESTNKDFKRYRWGEDKNGNMTDTPVHLHSHAPDALRYGLYTHFFVPGIMDGDYDFS